MQEPLKHELGPLRAGRALMPEIGPLRFGTFPHACDGPSRAWNRPSQTRNDPFRSGKGPLRPGMVLSVLNWTLSGMARVFHARVRPLQS